MPDSPPIKVYWHNPAPIFVAQVNMPSGISYPIDEIAFDNVTTGAYTDIDADMFFTLGSAAGLDDYGRGRVRGTATSTLLKVNRSSQGFNDGELNVVDNAWIAIFEDYRVWSKIPVILSDGTMLKDSDIPVHDPAGSPNQQNLTEEPPPVANTGPDCARSIDAGTSTITVFFPGSTSIAVADGATIAGYAWDVDGGTILFGGTVNDADITVEFGAGVYNVSLTVTDSNSKTHTSHCLILADDPDNSLCVASMQVRSISRSQQGQTMTLRTLADLPRADYPDGAKVLAWEDRDPLVFGAPDPTSRAHMLFVGWHQSDNASARALETHLQRDTELMCVDVSGRMDSLPGFSQEIALLDETDPDFEGVTWALMAAPNLDKYIHYLLQWHSTVLSVADYFPSGTGSEYPFVFFQSDGASLYDQVQRKANQFVPDRNFTCNELGQLEVIVNPMLQNPADRTATIQGNFTEQGWKELQFSYTRAPRVHTLRGSAILTDTEWTLVEDTSQPSGFRKTLRTAFSIAPGTAPGQGVQEQTIGERLAKSQADLNDVVGHHLARMNSRYGPVTVVPNLNNDISTLSPANMTWVLLVVSADTAPQREAGLGSVRCLLKEVVTDYDYPETGTVKRQRAILELETEGLPALTEEFDEALPVGEQPVPVVFTPPDFDDPVVYGGNVTGYVLWDGAHVMRTWDLQAASPVWELVDSGITGAIFEGLIVHYATDTVGMWLLTSDAIWWCADIMAATPSWSAVLPIATVQAADAVPFSGVVEFKCMAEYASAPGSLVVATGPVDNDISYAHAYFWRTTDYGVTWQQVDMNAFLEQSPFQTAPTGNRGYCHAGRFNMGIFRSEPIIWCVRNVPRDATDDHQAVFKSTDLGDTWTMAHKFPDQANNDGPGAFLIPYPSITDPSYAVRGSTTDIQPYKSTDAWATAAATGIPADYAHFGSRWRPNSNTFEPNHLLAWVVHNATNIYHLMESDDAGATWTLVYNSGETESSGDARHNTPNGWPPDVLQWVMVRAVGDFASGPVVQLTLDNFATLLDKEGNLSTLLGGIWTPGLCGGIALPKVGENSA